VAVQRLEGCVAGSTGHAHWTIGLARMALKRALFWIYQSMSLTEGHPLGRLVRPQTESPWRDQPCYGTATGEKMEQIPTVAHGDFHWEEMRHA